MILTRAARWCSSVKVTTQRAEWEYFKEEMKGARDDEPVLRYFTRRVAANDPSAVKEAYIGMFQRTGAWNYAAENVQMATDTLNLILKSFILLGTRKDASAAWLNNRLTRLMAGMEQEPTTSVSVPNSETYSLYLSSLADQVYRGKSHRRPLDVVNHCLSQLSHRNLEMTPEIYTAIIKIYNSQHKDPRTIFHKAMSEGIPPSTDLLSTLCTTAILLKDMTVVERCYEAMHDDKVPTYLLVKMLQLTTEIGGGDGLLTRLLEEIPGETKLNKGILRNAVKYAFKDLDRPKTALGLIEKFAKGAHDTDHAGMGMRLYLSHVVVEKDMAAFVKGFRELAVYLPKGSLPVAYENVDWYMEAIDRLVKNKDDLEKLLSLCTGKEAWMGMLIVSGYSRLGMLADAMLAGKEWAKKTASALPCLALLQGFDKRSHDRHHEEIYAFMKDSETPVTPQAFDLLITLACQADDLDTALLYTSHHTEAHPSHPLAGSTLSHLLYSACTTGDLPLTIGILKKLRLHSILLPIGLKESCLEAIKRADWRGTCVPKLQEEYNEYLNHVMGAHRDAMELSLDEYVKKI
eukprot:TRINITY_DN20801_c0_g1_i1.p1 TRINITY_DN20801_c0_g1~~TRINITY_DN20801_c0_g1_i1.p1  ORF type:complete len:574 (+),score=109.96 TRINITY_DN20801_c0_g1_i1:59-1780(+)